MTSLPSSSYHAGPSSPTNYNGHRSSSSSGHGHGHGNGSSPPAFNPGQSPNYSFTRPRQPSPYMRSLLVYLDAVNARDFGSMEAVFDDALEHRILPKSMNRPVLTKRQYIDYWKGVMSMFAKFEASTRGRSFSGTPYTNEYILLLHFTQPQYEGDLPKIRYLKEFVDSTASLNFFKEESERRKRREEEKRKVWGVGVSNGVSVVVNSNGEAGGSGHGNGNGNGYANGNGHGGYRSNGYPNGNGYSNAH
ncbi:hypothetical protein CC1G_04653 [Coprinopsis cinerea okayama7|uniref:Uncharacterized protein n=1 Tax=Coprinopsis cinerea (strain Okayama-7 / 130 / ATCC MYA-4618 / FGSC 9003) TaxID=240176 RepID=A8N546_COPC7|nr:hypothetical protein CC1G_04653 [Coprinopsis cinerea okayama7\|eukprot:XP_001829964.1 hypothetical protein CC1G_04653 [Coprinopsis cinerea okayama7\